MSPVGPVGGSVGRLEIEHAVDIAIGIERQTLDRVLRVVGEEVAALVAAGELGAVIDEAAGDGRVAPVVGIGVDGVRKGWIAARPFDIGPAIVGAPHADIQFLDGRRSVVAADVTDEQPTRGCVVIGAIGIAQPQRPDGVVVGAGPVVERVVGRHRAVGVESQDLAARAGQILRGRALEVVAGGEVDLSVVAEIDCAAVVFGVGVLGILVDDEFAARYGAGQRGIGREAREAIAVGCARRCRRRNRSGWWRSSDPGLGHRYPAARRSHRPPSRHW